MRTASKIFTFFFLAVVISVFTISGMVAPAQAQETIAEAKKLSARANTLRHQRKFDKAEALYKRSLKIRTTVLGAGHTEVGHALFEMAPVYFRKNEFHKAERVLKSALAIYEKNLGSDHSHIANTLSRLAYVYGANGKSASSIQTRAAAMRKRLAGAPTRMKRKAKAPTRQKRMAKAPGRQKKSRVDRRSQMEKLAGAPIGQERLADGRTLREWFEGR
jgi:tetratricopeptide (TPR) repeat protein